MCIIPLHWRCGVLHHALHHSQRQPIGWWPTRWHTQICRYPGCHHLGMCTHREVVITNVVYVMCISLSLRGNGRVMQYIAHCIHTQWWRNGPHITSMVIMFWMGCGSWHMIHDIHPITCSGCDGVSIHMIKSGVTLHYSCMHYPPKGGYMHYMYPHSL